MSRILSPPFSQYKQLFTVNPVPQGPAAHRAASPLPPNVPTGPRNPGNKYKDRDNISVEMSGLDYGVNGGSGKKDTVDRDRESEERTSRCVMLAAFPRIVWYRED